MADSAPTNSSAEQQRPAVEAEETSAVARPPPSESSTSTSTTTPWTSTHPPAKPPSTTENDPESTKTPVRDVKRSTPQQTTVSHRGPNTQVNYKIKFQKSRERYHRVLGESQVLTKGLREAQRKEAKLQQEIDWLLDAIAQTRPDLVDVVLAEEEAHERYKEERAAAVQLEQLRNEQQ